MDKVDISMQLAQGLRALHEHRVQRMAHGDLKPGCGGAGFGWETDKIIGLL